MLKKIQNKAESQLRFWHVVANEWPLAQRGSSSRLTPLTRYILKKSLKLELYLSQTLCYTHNSGWKVSLGSCGAFQSC